jgi:hypothetical protein
MQWRARSLGRRAAFSERTGRPWPLSFLEKSARRERPPPFARARNRALRLGNWGLLWLVALVAWCTAQGAAAQGRGPLDLNLSARELALVPDAPADFSDERIGRVRMRFHPSDEGIARRLEAKIPAALRKVTAELGISHDQELEIRIARGPRDMAALAPRSSPPPPYAVGVAYPALGLIILSVVDPQSWFPPNLGEVLTHELSHIALYRAAGERHLPLWFVEGLAVHQAGEHRLQRIQTLWEAAVVDDVLPVSSLSAHFPARPNQVNLAYAQSADLVEHLLRSRTDRSRLAELLAEVKAGSPFEQGLLATYHVDLSYLEREWRRSLGERYRVLPMLLTGTALWGGIAILAVVAFLRRRKQQREKLSRWAEEEAQEDRARNEVPLTPALSTSPTAPEPELFVVVTQSRDSAVPTIEHEGQRYTLH